MKSSSESRKLFREKIESAMLKTSDSDELKSALDIIDDLDSALEVIALSAEYNFRKRSSIASNYFFYDDDDDDKELEKVYDLYIHHLDLFLGVGVFGGVWRNSQHWIATTFARLFKSSTVTSSSSLNTNPSNPYMKFYVDELKKILHEIGSNAHNIKVILKTSGYFELSSSKNKIYLKFEYVTGRVTMLDDKLKTMGVYSDTETTKMATKIKDILL